MNDQLLDAIPLWAFLIMTAAGLGLTLESGYQIGLWRRRHAPEERDQSVGAMVASILGLLALVLGFTFGLVAARSDARRSGVLGEANAIGTTYLRTRLLPERQRAESARLLREYLDVRIQAIEETVPLDQALARSQALHESMWHQATAAATEHSSSPALTGLYVQSLNQVIEMHATRPARRSRPPATSFVDRAASAGRSRHGIRGLPVCRRSNAPLACDDCPGAGLCDRPVPDCRLGSRARRLATYQPETNVRPSGIDGCAGLPRKLNMSTARGSCDCCTVEHRTTITVGAGLQSRAAAGGAT